MKSTPIKILETEAEYKAAQKRVSELMKKEFDTNSEIYHEAKLLLLLIEDYQKKNIHIDEPDPIRYIQIRMEELGLND